MKNKKNNIFGFFQENMKNVEKKSTIIKQGQGLLKKAKIDEKKNNNIFWIFSGKYGKMQKKVKNDEKWSQISEKGQN